MPLLQQPPMSDSARAIALMLGVAIPLGLGAPAAAQAPELRLSPATDAPPGPAAAPADEALKERARQLDAIQAEQKKAAESEAQLRREIDEIGDDRRKLNQRLIDTAPRLRESEARLSATETRLPVLDERELLIRRSLESRRAVIAEVLAALQRIGRRPPPAILVQPEDALQAVRTAILLGAVVPEMRAQAEALSTDLTELAGVRRALAEERARLASELAAMTDERRHMALLVEERQRRQGEAEKALDSERKRAGQLSRQADDLRDLIAKLEHSLESANRSARAAARADEEAKRPDARASLAALNNPGRLGPAIAFASARGLLPLPVNGIRVRDFGGTDGFGGIDKGLSIATRAGAQVTAPCDGWVVYAGPFRSYGQLLILNAGGGYHVLLAGMDRISVDLGQFVLTGEPVAVMGGGAQRAPITAAGSNQPALYVEFRKDGTPIDPGPWWASEGEKVRG
jgi:septal ring factor EnvC (AmiA/AmiB activator)